MVSEDSDTCGCGRLSHGWAEIGPKRAICWNSLFVAWRCFHICLARFAVFVASPTCTWVWRPQRGWELGNGDGHSHVFVFVFVFVFAFAFAFAFVFVPTPVGGCGGL